MTDSAVWFVLGAGFGFALCYGIFVPDMRGQIQWLRHCLVIRQEADAAFEQARPALDKFFSEDNRNEPL